MAATIAKTIVTTQASQKSVVPGWDVPYEASLATLWSAVDQSLVIVLGCVPPLYGFIAPLVHSNAGSMEETGSGHGTGPTFGLNLAETGFDGNSKRPVVLGPGAAMEEELLRETTIDRSRGGTL
ncbi:hypothetical protein KJ359_005432 [Pestalotiopsis sp. 9143b]|nr:hypothetical protein KJ359_005432 [Pestalotiopsis sp. 9143b]